MQNTQSSDDSPPSIVELVCKIPISKGELAEDKPHHDLLKLGSSVAIAPKFEEMS